MPRRFQFSLCALLVTILVVAYVAGACDCVKAVEKGERVVVISRPAKVKIKTTVVAWVGRGQTFPVKEIEDGWYWIDFNGGSGWLNARDAVTIDEAIDLVSRDIARAPTASDYKLRARLLIESGRAAEARADFDEAIHLDPADFLLYGDRALFRQAQGDGDGCLADLDLMVRIVSDNPILKEVAFAIRDQLWLEIRNYERALADAETVIAGHVSPSAGFALAAWIMATCPDERFRDGAKARRIRQEGLQHESGFDYRPGCDSRGRLRASGRLQAGRQVAKHGDLDGPQDGERAVRPRTRPL